MNSKELSIVNKIKNPNKGYISDYKNTIFAISNIDNIDKYKKLIDWERFSRSLEKGDLNLFEKFKDYILWNKVSEYVIRDMPLEFINKYKDYITLDILIHTHYQLSEDYIEKHFDDIGSFDICRTQKLSEEFIERNINKLKLLHICRFQDISKEFLYKHEDLITSRCFDHLIDNMEFSEKEIEYFIDKISLYGWNRLSLNIDKFSDTFISKYSDKIDWSNVIFYASDKEFLEKYYDKWSSIAYTVLQNILSEDRNYYSLTTCEDSGYFLIRDIIKSHEGYISSYLNE